MILPPRVGGGWHPGAVVTGPTASGFAAAEGCYDAARAAALSGVPERTVYAWAAAGVVRPTISPEREKLWSFADLMALRIVFWLRHPRDPVDGTALRASPMPDVRRALRQLERDGIDLWAPGHAPPVQVDRAGRVFVLRADGRTTDVHGHDVLLPDDALDLVAPYQFAGGRGPHLLRPRDHLRIVPAKVAGAPHIRGSRVTTAAVAALAARGLEHRRIAALYGVATAAVRDAVDLEHQLMPGAVAA